MKRAREILAEKPEELKRSGKKPAALDEIIKIAGRLKDGRYFSLARKLYSKARQHPDAKRLDAKEMLKLVQKHALGTYKDTDLSSERYKDALKILAEGDLNAATPSQETLGQAGAIYKNLWRLGGQRRDLERSCEYYRRGWQQSLSGDFGYTGINAAFMLDQLAAAERRDGGETARKSAEERTKEALAIREKIAKELPKLADLKEYAWLKGEWWYYATLAEANLGSAKFEEARQWLKEGLKEQKPPDWQLEAAARQLASLAYAQGMAFNDGSEEWNTLKVLAGEGVPALRGIEIGKVGLALSGGGFRAALFHIGVLARLAELDVLRHVEVLSCVSGGSIVGAHYYLEVRKLLQEKEDSKITREDYIKIVARMEQDFLAGVQKNLRTRLFANLGPNLLSLFAPGYTRTNRLGALYEEHFYNRIKTEKKQPASGSPDSAGKEAQPAAKVGEQKPAEYEQAPFYLENLRIEPKNWQGDFNPKLDNWRRSAKAPILLLNAAALNTGHTWQFSVSWMGEPPALGDSVDRNETLRRMYYWEAPQKYKTKKIRLGHAVAASSCVPGLFDPIEFTGLYPDRTVRLVDGGVHDNQGVGGLLEQECSVVLISDASGQMNSMLHPSAENFLVPMRANSILQARIREAEALHAESLRESSALNGLMFLHLKQELQAKPVDWVKCDDPYEPAAGQAASSNNEETSYGIPKQMQALIAGIRTDLDSFSDAEAYSLMFSGYQMADKNFRECVPGFPIEQPDKRCDWNFLQVGKLLQEQAECKKKNQNSQKYEKLLKQLKTGGSLAFKVWRLSPVALVLGVVVSAALIAGGTALYMYLKRASLDLGSTKMHVSVLLAAVLLPGGLWLLHRPFGSRKSLSVLFTGWLLGTVGWIVAFVHLILFDPLFLRDGAMKKTTEKEQAKAAQAGQ